MLQLEGVTRTFGDRVAVHEISLEVRAGETVVLLGPNGAGKTTLLRLMAGLLPATHGRVLLNGVPIASARDARGSIGLLTETPGLWERLSVGTNLETYARLQGVPDPETAVQQALAALHLEDRRATRASALSRGMKQKVALARALLHEPRLVLLDEPTNALDPQVSREVRTLIMRLRGEGRAVVVSTHNLDEAERIATRVAVLNCRLVAYDTPEALDTRWRSTEVRVRFAGQSPGAFLAAARPIAGTGVRIEQQQLVFDTETPDTVVPRLVQVLVAAGARVAEVSPQRRALESIYLELMEGHAGEG